jgi:hypothetical protein
MKDAEPFIKRSLAVQGDLCEHLTKHLTKMAARMVNEQYLIEEEDPDKVEVQGTETDPVLDPAMDREFFHKSFTEGENVVTIKTIGVGRNKPVSVYINDVRWEMFPGPIRAEEEVKKFIKSDAFEGWRQNIIASTEDDEIKATEAEKKVEEESSSEDEEQ